MNNVSYRNASLATRGGLRDLLSQGAVLHVRSSEIREIRNRITTLDHPSERCLFLPHRKNNVFASLAETFWVLGGRDDIGWLEAYLPNATDYSDDGNTWRGAYGPRLRNWNGIDQLKEVRLLLLNERLTRRAVMILYDPDRDFVESKDIPCNNWLHWLVRDDHLHLNIAVRSNDVVWGFSGVNSFEWSILQEMMAFWVGVPIGEAAYFASSFHLYLRHYRMAERLIAASTGVTCYDFGIKPPPFQTPWEAFDDALATWFVTEQALRQSPDLEIRGSHATGDPLLDGALQVLRVYWGAQQGWPVEQLRKELASLPEIDLVAAAYEYFGRKLPTLLDGIAQPRIAAFFQAFRHGVPATPSTIDATSLKDLIQRLHRRKDAAYGNAWKRRGELTSILANIARKVDRIDSYATAQTTLAEETILDTAIDLFVYITKYRLFLMELAPDSALPYLPVDAYRPFSDHTANFDALVQCDPFPAQLGASIQDLAAWTAQAFEELHAEATKIGSAPEDRIAQARHIAELAFLLVVTIAVAQPETYAAFWRTEATSGQ